MPGIILVNPDYYEDIFSKSKVRSAISRGTMHLGLACIGAALLSKGNSVHILDLNLADDPEGFLRDNIARLKPQFVGITATTPLIMKAYKIAQMAKEIDEGIVVVAGGPHTSALPEDVLKESRIDCVVSGEGDFILNAIVENGLSEDIPNIYYKANGKIVRSKVQGYYTNDLDDLPYPAYELLDIKKYSQPFISSRKAPLGYMETSRGCYARCVFCNKNIHGLKVRMKSSLRVVDEMERMLKLGFQEVHIIDDIFTSDMARAYNICEEILRRGLKFPWYPRGGIRVEKVNLALLKIMKKAGCYRIPFGIESGSQRIIDRINKKITIDRAIEAVSLAKKAGLETECYFMIGHQTETEEDIKKPIDLAIKLNPDYVKFALTIPLPGTVMFDEMLANGQIKTKDWSKYNFSTSPKELYEHDILSWRTIERYSDISVRKFYFRPKYILRMLYKTVSNGTFFAHLKAFLKTRW
jgi:anaerobic magnesium-protoporphyrin IX monomethyl ester cyclase